jgi:hypothetical protein
MTKQKLLQTPWIAPVFSQTLYNNYKFSIWIDRLLCGNRIHFHSCFVSICQTSFLSPLMHIYYLVESHVVSIHEIGLNTGT